MYSIERKPWVQSQYKALPDRIRKDVAEIILDLKENPTPNDSIAMFDEYEGFRRIRVDGYRIVYKIDEVRKEVVVWKIAPRNKDTYKKLVP